MTNRDRNSKKGRNSIKRTCLFVMAATLCLIVGCHHYTTLVLNGDPSEKLIIILVPSHYYGENADDNPLWITDANNFKNRLMDHHFFSRYSNKINVYRLNSSTSDDFKMSGSNWIPDQARIKAFVLDEVSFIDFDQNDQIIFIIESEGYENDPQHNPNIGLTRGDPNLTQIMSSRIGSLVHEFGHSFGRLGDEYPKKHTAAWVSTYPNIATVHDGVRCENKWNDLMNIVIKAQGTWIEGIDMRNLRTVGCYIASHEESEGISYKPTESACIMDQINDSFPFCPVCRRHLISLLENYTPYLTCNLGQDTYRDRVEFEEACNSVTIIDFDQTPDGTPIEADSPGVLADNIYSDVGIHFTAGVIFGEPNLPFGGESPPNIISNSGINLPERTLVAGYIDDPVCALGITNTGAQAVLRVYDEGFNVIASIVSDTDANSNDFMGLVTSKPIYRFEIDFVSGIGFGADDLLLGR